MKQNGNSFQISSNSAERDNVDLAKMSFQIILKKEPDQIRPHGTDEQWIDIGLVVKSILSMDSVKIFYEFEINEKPHAQYLCTV